MTPSAPVPRAKGLNCPNCGGALEIRGFAATLSVVCPQCLSILDAKDPNLRILQEFHSKVRATLKIPLGSRGQWKGATYEVIGFQQRVIEVDGIEYSWDEYLLFNPYRGYRYLTEYNGHWNDVRTVRALPQQENSGSKPKVNYGGVSYTHFQSAVAKTDFVLGEFPWRTCRGEVYSAEDFISPPSMLSSESTQGETVWSKGEYTSGEEIWKAFKPPGPVPEPVGVFANQPSPHEQRKKGMWRLFLLFLLLTVVIGFATCSISRNQEVFRQRYVYTPGAVGDASFVTNRFDLTGRPSNVQVSIRTDVNNNWAYFGIALINEDTGTAYDFGREVSYYTGRDSDGSWSEGSAGDTSYVPRVPAGRYYLRVEPEMAPGGRSMEYEIRLRRDVHRSAMLWFVLFLITIPPVWTWWRYRMFEYQRWQESDYASSSSESSSEGDDD